MDGRSIASRLPEKFKIVFSSGERDILHLSGPVTSVDEMDALMSALTVLREWLPDTPAPTLLSVKGDK